MRTLSHSMMFTVLIDPLEQLRGLMTSPLDESHRRCTPAAVESVLKPFLCLAPCLRRSSSHSIRHCTNSRVGPCNEARYSLDYVVSMNRQTVVTDVIR
jgi:hypothetical protein